MRKEWRLVRGVQAHDVATAQFESPTGSSTPCAICSAPVELEMAKTDEEGRAVHEECYTQKLENKLALGDPPEKDLN